MCSSLFQIIDFLWSSRNAFINPVKSILSLDIIYTFTFKHPNDLYFQVFSDCDMTEEELNADSIQIGQSAVDFANLRYPRDSGMSMTSSLGKRSRTRHISHFSGFSEFAKIKEEPLGKIGYLTPKEAKAMQVRRRRYIQFLIHNSPRPPLPYTQGLNFHSETPSITSVQHYVPITL